MKPKPPTSAVLTHGCPNTGAWTCASAAYRQSPTCLLFRRAQGARTEIWRNTGNDHRPYPALAHAHGELSGLGGVRLQRLSHKAIRSICDPNAWPAIRETLAEILSSYERVNYVNHGGFHVRNNIDKYTERLDRVANEFAAPPKAEREMDNLIAGLLREIIDWGAWGGPTLIVDTETWDADTGQVMRLGVAQLRGLEYRELHDFRGSVKGVGRSGTNSIASAQIIFFTTRQA